MGDRAQVAIKQGAKTVYLYTHWGGSELPSVVRAALARQQRWDDPEYLTRIIFCQMVKRDVDAETGFGIGTQLHDDNEHPLITVDPDKQTIKIGSVVMAFADFIKSHAEA